MISFNRLLSVDSPKAVKSIQFGWLNAIHYMAPASTGGVGNLCQGASIGCMLICLGKYSGQAAMVTDLENGTNSVRDSRIAKAQMFMKERETYLGHLENQIRRLVAKADSEDLKPCIRLNGSTDIPFERMRYGAKRLTLLEIFPDIQFVDYTKIYSRLAKAPANLSLTFSRSETNEAECLQALSGGHNVAVVFGSGLPATWHGYEVISGDLHDLRHLDPRAARGYVIGLTPKGAKAKKDTSGFVLFDYSDCVMPLALAA